MIPFISLLAFGVGLSIPDAKAHPLCPPTATDLGATSHGGDSQALTLYSTFEDWQDRDGQAITAPLVADVEPEVFGLIWAEPGLAKLDVSTSDFRSLGPIFVVEAEDGVYVRDGHPRRPFGAQFGRLDCPVELDGFGVYPYQVCMLSPAIYGGAVWNQWGAAVPVCEVGLRVLNLETGQAFITINPTTLRAMLRTEHRDLWRALRREERLTTDVMLAYYLRAQRRSQAN